METPGAHLKTHIEYVCRDLGEVLVELNSVKNRMRYFAVAVGVAISFFSWIASNRFEQIAELLAK